MEKRSKITFNLWSKITCLFYEERDGKLVKRELKWFLIILFAVIHSVALYTTLFFWRHITHPFLTLPFTTLYTIISGVGVTGGAHRLWTHRSYKANLPLRIILATSFYMAGLNTIPQWALDHRVHHKYTETDADPHNAARGFFFSHVGWIMQEKSIHVKNKWKEVDMSDVLADPVVQFFTKYYNLLKISLAFVLPTVIPVYLWDESWTASILITVLRYAWTLNIVWSVNSAAHLWGSKPYDKRIGPVENKLVSIFSHGEGWHNYHHVFPWDYKASELAVGPNLTTKVIHFFARLGWAYNLKSPSDELVRKVSEKYGDGSRWGYEVQPPVNGSAKVDVIYLNDVDGEKQKRDFATT